MNDPHAALEAFFAAGHKSNGSMKERRLYKKLWQRVRSLDPAFRLKRSEQGRARRANPRHRAADYERTRKWYRRRRRYASKKHAKYYREFLQLLCFFCGQPARGSGHRGFKRIERVVLEHGSWVQKTVLWCGCFGDQFEKPLERGRPKRGVNAKHHS